MSFTPPGGPAHHSTLPPHYDWKHIFICCNKFASTSNPTGPFVVCGGWIDVRDEGGGTCRNGCRFINAYAMYNGPWREDDSSQEYPGVFNGLPFLPPVEFIDRIFVCKEVIPWGSSSEICGTLISNNTTCPKCHSATNKWPYTGPYIMDQKDFAYPPQPLQSVQRNAIFFTWKTVPPQPNQMFRSAYCGEVIESVWAPSNKNYTSASFAVTNGHKPLFDCCSRVRGPSIGTTVFRRCQGILEQGGQCPDVFLGKCGHLQCSDCNPRNPPNSVVLNLFYAQPQ